MQDRWGSSVYLPRILVEHRCCDTTCLPTFWKVPVRNPLGPLVLGTVLPVWPLAFPGTPPQKEGIPWHPLTPSLPLLGRSPDQPPATAPAWGGPPRGGSKCLALPP